MKTGFATDTGADTHIRSWMTIQMKPAKRTYLHRLPAKSEIRLPAKITEWMPANMPAKAGGKAGKAGGKAGKAGGKAGKAGGKAGGEAVPHLLQLLQLLHLLLHNSGEATAAIKRLPAKITYVRTGFQPKLFLCCGRIAMFDRDVSLAMLKTSSSSLP